MAQRTDAIVLGAGIVGTSVALQLVKRGLSVALVDRRGPGEETSYGNTGVIVGASVFPTAFPRSLKKLIQVALKRAPEANYHWGDLLQDRAVAVSYFNFSTPEKLKDSAVKLRPLMSRSVAEHEALMQESGAMKYLRKTGWMTLYRSDAAFEAMKPQLEFGAQIGVAAQPLDTEGALALEPSLAPVFRHALMWPDVASLSNPLMVTRAYAARFAALGGVVHQRRCALAASRRRQVARRHRRGAAWTPTTPWWRSAHGRPTCWSRSASRCRSASSAAITATSTRRAMRRCRGRSSIPNMAMRSRRWSRASA